MHTALAICAIAALSSEGNAVLAGSGKGEKGNRNSAGTHMGSNGAANSGNGKTLHMLFPEGFAIGDVLLHQGIAYKY